MLSWLFLPFSDYSRDGFRDVESTLVAAVINPNITHMLGMAKESKENAATAKAISASSPEVPQYVASKFGIFQRYRAHPSIAMRKATNAAVPTRPVSASKRK